MPIIKLMEYRVEYFPINLEDYGEEAIVNLWEITSHEVYVFEQSSISRIMELLMGIFLSVTYE